MAIRTIRTFDEPILRKKSKTVQAIDDRARAILNDMLDTLRDSGNGAAIAAPQVGILKRLIVIEMEDQLYKLVNPVLVSSHGEQYEIEGCLSFPGLWGKVRRPMEVEVEALDENGKKVTIHATGDMAKCLCHEMDHLEGVVLLDKAEEWVDVT